MKRITRTSSLICSIRLICSSGIELTILPIKDLMLMPNMKSLKVHQFQSILIVHISSLFGTYFCYKFLD